MSEDLSSSFQKLNKQYLTIEPALGENIRCPICWKLFGANSLQERRLSKEHVPPTKVARLTGEKRLVTLTCKECNSGFGTKCQNDLKRFLIHQLQHYGKYNKPIRGEVVVENSAPVRSDITLTPGAVKITGVPQSNNPRNIEVQSEALDGLVEKGITNWHSTVTVNYGYRLPLARLAYLHAAYLVAIIRTKYHYAYSEAGEQLRGLFSDNDQTIPQDCVIDVLGIGVGEKPWIAEITDPLNLRCLWVKVAGNIVILPLPDGDIFSCSQEWSQVCDTTPFGMRPRSKLSFRVNFLSKEDVRAAANCLPSVLSRRRG